MSSSMAYRDSDSKNPSFYSRKEKSLGVLCSNFFKLYNQDGVDSIGLDNAASRLGLHSIRLVTVFQVTAFLIAFSTEKSKMNYRAWYHRSWLVSYMSRGQVLHELNKNRDWAGLHVADNSCFHYRTRLMLRMLEDSFHKQDPIVCPGYDAELHQVWKAVGDQDDCWEVFKYARDFRKRIPVGEKLSRGSVLVM